MKKNMISIITTHQKAQFVVLKLTITSSSVLYKPSIYYCYCQYVSRISKETVFHSTCKYIYIFTSKYSSGSSAGALLKHGLLLCKALM